MKTPTSLPSGSDKLEIVAVQMAEMEAGTEYRILCPYCMGQTKRGREFCCDLLARAFAAILDAREQLDMAKTMDDLMDRHVSSLASAAVKKSVTH